MLELGYSGDEPVKTSDDCSGLLEVKGVDEGPVVCSSTDELAVEHRNMGSSRPFDAEMSVVMLDDVAGGVDDGAARDEKLGDTSRLGDEKICEPS